MVGTAQKLNLPVPMGQITDLGLDVQKERCGVTERSGGNRRLGVTKNMCVQKRRVQKPSDKNIALGGREKSNPYEDLIHWLTK